QAEDGIRDRNVTGVQTCALPICGYSSLPKQAMIQAATPGLVQWAEPETKGEAFIPLAASKRRRSLAIWEETGRHLGALPRSFARSEERRVGKGSSYRWWTAYQRN